MRNAAAALALSGVTLLIGCSRPTSSEPGAGSQSGAKVPQDVRPELIAPEPQNAGSKPDANVPQDGDAPPRYVVAADIVGRRLERRKDQPVWEFTADRFILTNHGKPAGAGIFDGATVAVRFEGAWRLSEDGRSV